VRTTDAGLEVLFLVPRRAAGPGWAPLTTSGPPMRIAQVRAVVGATARRGCDAPKLIEANLS
jgi:hypothetical protein